MHLTQPYTFQTPVQEESPKWFILNYVAPSLVRRDTSARKTIDRFNAACQTSLELFAPTFVRMIEIDGRHIRREAPLTYQYVFVRGNDSHVKSLCLQPNGFSFVLNHCGAERYATVDDRTMESFKTIARAYANRLPFYPLDGIDLEEGDTVEIVEGDFPGLVGTFMPRPRSTSGNIVIAVTQNLGTVVYDIKARYVRVLEFSRNSRRAYDQIDAHVPRLLAALRRQQSGQRLTEADIRNLTLFVRRLGQTRIASPKLDAKLQALLRASAYLLGDSSAFAAAQSRLDRLRPSVTSASTQALLHLLDYAVDGQPSHLADGHRLLSTLTAPSRQDTLLLAELNHYQQR